MPGYALTFMVFMMASIGLPGTSGFIGEFLVIIGSFQVSFWLALFGGMGMILGAAYMLYLYRRVIFGRLTKQDLRNILDLSPREWAVFAPLIVLTFWMGVYPSSFSSFFDASVAAMVKQHIAALAVPAYPRPRLLPRLQAPSLPRVMAGLDPAHDYARRPAAWMAGSSPAMSVGAARPRHGGARRGRAGAGEAGL